MSKGKFLSGLLFGAAAGAVAGILLAPDKGTETRKKMVKKANDLKTNVRERVEMVAGKVNDAAKSFSGNGKKENTGVSENMEQPNGFTTSPNAEQQHFSS